MQGRDSDDDDAGAGAGAGANDAGADAYDDAPDDAAPGLQYDAASAPGLHHPCNSNLVRCYDSNHQRCPRIAEWTV